MARGHYKQSKRKKTMIDVSVLSAQELEAQRKISEALIKKSEEGKRLAAINAELAKRKKSARKFVLASWEKYGVEKGVIHMPYLHPITCEKEYGPEVPWSLTVTQPAAEPFPTIRYTLTK
jgi:hypothetical protein